MLKPEDTPIKSNAPPKKLTYIPWNPENRPLEKEIPIEHHDFYGPAATVVFGGVIFSSSKEASGSHHLKTKHIHIYTTYQL